MSNLISGKEALIALANGKDVLYIGKTQENHPERSWGDAKEIEAGDFLLDSWSFKLKPKTISLNGISIPAPFEPKTGDAIWFINPDSYCGYSDGDYDPAEHFCQFGAWRTEGEIKQVVEALRSVFKGA